MVNWFSLVAAIIPVHLSVFNVFCSRYNRLQVVRQMRWDFGSILPPDIKYNLSEQEVRNILQQDVSSYALQTQNRLNTLHPGEVQSIATRVSVCLCLLICLKNHIQTSRNFLRMLCVAMAWSWSDNNAVHCLDYWRTTHCDLLGGVLNCAAGVSLLSSVAIVYMLT